MYKVKFMFDYCADSCVWAVNKESEKICGEGIIPFDKLSISDGLKTELKNLCREYNSSLNWDDPSDGTPWDFEQIERFRLQARKAYDKLLIELGNEFEIENLIDMSLEF